MKSKLKVSLSVAILSVAAFSAAQARAFESQPAAFSVEATAMQSDAARMVPAQASLAQTLDANKIQPGQQFKATLSDKIKLKDGTELPRGTVLIGTADNGQANGKSTLTLHFTQAQLKDSKTITIAVTIVDLVPASNVGYTTVATWNPKQLQVLQQNVLNGVDLESHIGGASSGTFVAAKKDSLKLAKGCALTLAIGTAQGS
ncbi:MAG TPA: hypothetical protein VFC37_16800 [Terracidiphilus sp.]|jgi:hypothetical protein|nr:hypothetical protein [Terracidiphilus sp.]